MTDDTSPLAPRVDGARGDEMRDRMQAGKDAGVCDFCEIIAGGSPRHRSPVVLEGQHWVATYNDFPYPGTDHHILIIAREHVNDLRELSSAALAEGMQFWVRVADHFGLTGYCPFGRIGDRDLTAQTMPHLHFHITQSDGESVALEDIEAYYLGVLAQLPDGMSGDPKRLKKLWEAISLLRSVLEGKATGIYPKLSNEATKS